MDRILPYVSYLPHAALVCLAVLAGIQDWRKREVSDWLTWPPFLFGLASAIVNAVKHLDLLPLVVSVFLIVTWYCGWMGGADVRIFIGLWGLWPLAGLLALAGTGLWGLVLVLRKRGKEKIPALVSTGFAVCLTFLGEMAKIFLEVV